MLKTLTTRGFTPIISSADTNVSVFAGGDAMPLFFIHFLSQELRCLYLKKLLVSLIRV